MSRVRMAAALGLTALVTGAVGWLGRAPYAPAGEDAALLRLSWRLRGERAEVCRPRTQAELDALPFHMRTPEVCEGRAVTYRLRIQVDDDAPDTLRLVPRGAKGDRPIYVLHERAIAQGPHRVRIVFAPEDPAAGASPVVLDTVFLAAPGAVELVTLEGGRLVHRTGRRMR